MKFGALSRSLLVGFVLELLLYSNLIVLFFDTPLPWALAIALLAIPSVRAVLVVTTFIVAALYPGSTVSSIGTRALARVVGIEVLSTLRCLFHDHLWEGLLSTHDPESVEPGRTPVLMVHGYLANAGYWYRTRRVLETLGHRNLFTINLEPLLADIDRLAEVLSQRIEQILSRCGSERIILVGHSMGGLVVRRCALDHPQIVKQAICIGSPHKGTLLAYLAPGVNTRQMRPSNPWLRELNTHQGGAPVTALYSNLDNIIVPAESASLEGADNHLIEPMGHLSMAFSVSLHQRLSHLLSR